MVWMLSAAGIAAQGARGVARAQALAFIWARVMRVWLRDNDPGLGATMAALDRRLGEAERAAKCINRLEERFCPPSSHHRAAPATGPDLSEGHPS
jgi:hypothetical protein